MGSTQRMLVLLTAVLLLAIQGLSAGGCDPDDPGTCLEETVSDSLEETASDSLETVLEGCSPVDAGSTGCCGMDLPPLPEDPETVEEDPKEPS